MNYKLGKYLLAGGGSNTGGNVIKKFFNEHQIINLSKDINPNNSSGLEYYPLLKMGERFPINNPKLKPCLTPRPQSDSLFLHGLLESMAKIEKKSYEAISKLGGSFPEHILTVGGGANNKVWEKIRTNIT